MGYIDVKQQETYKKFKNRELFNSCFGNQSVLLIRNLL